MARRRTIALALAGVGLAAARVLAPRLHAGLLARCERMFEQAPDDFPPKRMLRGIEEIRANSARTLALLEAREPQARAPGRSRVPLGGGEKEDLAAVGAVARGPNEKGRQEQ